MTQCRDCGYEWVSRTQCHCTKCHVQFSSESAFTRHQTATGCANPAVATYTRGAKEGLRIYRPSEERYGVVWRFAERRPDKD